MMPMRGGEEVDTTKNDGSESLTLPHPPMQAASTLKDDWRAFKSNIVGVKFNYSDKQETSVTVACPLRFCEAVRLAHGTSQVTLPAEDFLCPASRIVFGIQRGDDVYSQCADNLVKAGRFRRKFDAMRAIRNLHSLRNNPSSVTLGGDCRKPDVLISKARPRVCMYLIQALQRMSVKHRVILSSGLAPVCGCCAVQCYLTGSLCMSFGCEDSRRYGGIEDDQVVLGIPGDIYPGLMDHVSIIAPEDTQSGASQR